MMPPLWLHASEQVNISLQGSLTDVISSAAKSSDAHWSSSLIKRRSGLVSCFAVVGQQTLVNSMHVINEASVLCPIHNNPP